VLNWLALMGDRKKQHLPLLAGWNQRSLKWWRPGAEQGKEQLLDTKKQRRPWPAEAETTGGDKRKEI
jgi:hypothetical protein